jgi:hypothetical protein
VPGYGLDCHRTFESLILGIIPILTESPFTLARDNPLYNPENDIFLGLPVVIIKSLDEINLPNLIMWKE